MGINLTHYDRSVIARHGNTSDLYADYMWDIVGDSSGLIWVATSSWGADPEYGGLCKFNGTTWTNYRTNNGLESNIINSLALDSSNNIWMATGWGLSKYNRSQFSNWDWLDYPGLTYSRGIAIENGNIVWLGSSVNIVRFNGTNWTTYYPPTGPGTIYIEDVAVDNAGNKWIATRGDGVYSKGNGVMKFDGSNWTIYVSEMADSNAHDISIAPNGDVWILSETGVSKFDGTNWTVYNSDNGLPWDNPIFFGEFGFGPNGVVWLAYGEGWAGGLMKFDPSTGKWTKYDCLQTAYGIAFCVHMQSATKLWIGGFMGIDVLEIPSY
jgi:ligand-binding sensor domain-containing protein